MNSSREAAPQTPTPNLSRVHSSESHLCIPLCSSSLTRALTNAQGPSLPPPIAVTLRRRGSHGVRGSLSPQRAFIFQDVRLRGFWMSQWRKDHAQGEPGARRDGMGTVVLFVS